MLRTAVGQCTAGPDGNPVKEKIELMLAEKRQLADELIDGDGEVGLT